MFYHLKTRHCVNTIHLVSKLKSHEKEPITKKHIVTHTPLNFVFKRGLHFKTLAMRLFSNGTKLFLSHNYSRNTMNQSPVKCFAICKTQPLLKLMLSALLVMKSG